MASDILSFALERLDVAEKLLAEMSTADTLRLQRECWWQFLQALDSSIGKFHAAAEHAKGPLLGWFGKVRAERKADPLLSYLQHARNADLHGLQIVISSSGAGWVAGPLLIGYPPPGEDDSLSQWVGWVESSLGEQFVYTVDPETGEGRELTREEMVSMGMAARVFPPHFALAPVTDRTVTYEPPIYHLQNPLIDNSPVSVGRLACLWVRSKLTEAEKYLA
ncbi:MAG: hypothetical protein A2792_00185 [Sphingomonadales bacterium RIFCSPHIGHO2_01_FULL_65_20]|nr:MAG: hypothetical protein A2792_00185 [Sphingomonadales bacterium RIFCSPHIGHO2_01_FULL_65_20]